MERDKIPMQRNPANSMTEGSGLAPHVVFTGGETGGNLFPGLAVAESLRQLLPQIQITFAGAGSRIERKEVQAASFAYDGLPCPAWPSSWSGLWQYFKDQRQAVHVAGEFIRQTGVVAVVGLGGAASLPIAKAAARAGVALALLEQNAVPGKATQKLCHSASLVCLSFAASRHRLTAAKRVRITGGPVRLDRSKSTAEQPRGSRILITGGMSGAEDLNHAVPRALYKIGRSVRHWQIVHQAGPSHVLATRELYRKFSLPAHVVPFLDDLPGWFSRSDLVVSRAGGTTLSELAATGVPAVLVPSPISMGDCERFNARCYTQAGAAITVDPHDHGARLDDELGMRLVPLLEDPQLRGAMGRSMSHLAFPRAAKDSAVAIAELIGVRPLAKVA